MPYDGGELNIGFIGLGQIGAPMARRIEAAGWDLTVWNRRGSAFGSAVVAPTLRAVGAACRVVCICVTAAPDVDEVVIASGLLDAMSAGSILLVHSSIAPSDVQRIGRAAATTGVQVLDAPVSGGLFAAEEGTMTTMVGGDFSAFTSVHPLLKAFASTVSHTGPLGSGLAAKLINNAYFVAQAGLARQAIDIAEKFGIDGATMQALLTTSSGTSFALTAPPTSADPEQAGHVLSLLDKDIRLFRQMLAETGAEPPQLEEIATTAIERLLSQQVPDDSAEIIDHDLLTVDEAKGRLYQEIKDLERVLASLPGDSAEAPPAQARLDALRDAQRRHSTALNAPDRYLRGIK